MEILKGIPVSPGFAIGEVFILDSEESIIPRRFISQDEVDSEIARFDQAVEKAKSDIRDLQARVSPEIKAEVTPIFDAHVMILSDNSLHDEVFLRIRNNRFTAEYAVSRSLRKFEKLFHQMEDSYLAQRVTDLKDIENRLLQALLGERTQELQNLDRPTVLVAHDLTPSQTASLDRERIIGFATDVGGRTGHTAIVARARELPAVVGLGTVSADVSSGDLLIIDGNRGIVVVSPDESTLETYRRMASDFHTFEESLIGEKDLPAETLDGCRASVMANIEFPPEVPTVLHYGGEGIGLYRTEFLYLNSDEEPDEKVHYEAYSSALKDIGEMPVSFRTLDLGADKFFNVDPILLNERNPVLGCRAIRHCLKHPEPFRHQLNAICRASGEAPGRVRLMLPMVSCRDEVTHVREMICQVQEQLAYKGIPFDPEMQIGIMVEVPSVALMAESFCDICDFFSIGTNDLIQYVIGVDRTNEHVADLFRPGHPAVLKLIKRVIDVGIEYNTPVSICGEMGADPTYVICLLGMGLRSFSLSPPLIPEIKKLIRLVTLEKAEEVAEHVLTLTTSREVDQYLRNFLHAFGPEWAIS